MYLLNLAVEGRTSTKADHYVDAVTSSSTDPHSAFEVVLAGENQILHRRCDSVCGSPAAQHGCHGLRRRGMLHRGMRACHVRCH